jgi:hypothetical protein
MRLFSPRKTTLLLVIRDKTKVCTVLETETHNFIRLPLHSDLLNLYLFRLRKRTLRWPLHDSMHTSMLNIYGITWSTGNSTRDIFIYKNSCGAPQGGQASNHDGA